MFQKNASKKVMIIHALVWVFLVVVSGISVTAQTYPQYPQQPYYNQQYDPNGQQDENYSSKMPFKVEIGRLEASVYRPGEEPLPLSQVPRLNKGDVESQDRQRTGQRNYAASKQLGLDAPGRLYQSEPQQQH
jgi:hypothetical protein